jgi:hypothetical protein
VSSADLMQTYLPAFENIVKDAKIRWSVLLVSQGPYIH